MGHNLGAWCLEADRKGAGCGPRVLFSVEGVLGQLGFMWTLVIFFRLRLLRVVDGRAKGVGVHGKLAILGGLRHTFRAARFFRLGHLRLAVESRMEVGVPGRLGGFPGSTGRFQPREIFQAEACRGNAVGVGVPGRHWNFPGSAAHFQPREIFQAGASAACRGNWGAR